MRYSAIARLLPPPLRRYILHFESEIERAVESFAAELPAGARVLDAGAGEGQYKRFFAPHGYVGIDLGIGDAGWNYRSLDAVADLERLPVAAGCFDAAVNVVTLEHVREPKCVLTEIARSLKPGGRLLLIVPHEWEVHQAPHDYYRYTRHGVEYLLGEAGFEAAEIQPVGGYFRLLARRLLNGLQFFATGPRWIGFLPAALFLVPPALILPLLDGLDRDRHFTLGYICKAIRRW